MDANRCCLFVLDRPTFQNVALADYLGRATGLDCRVVDAIPQHAGRTNALLLCNAHGKNPLEMLRWLDTAGGLTASAQVCLFNVQASQCPVEVLDFAFLKGVFSAQISHTQLVQGIKAVLAGDAWLPRHLLMEHLEKTRRRPRTRCEPAVTLTAREIEIVRHVAAGHTNGDIAQQMRVSIHTVKTHIYNLFRKIGVRNRTQATNWANLHLHDLLADRTATQRSSVPPKPLDDRMPVTLDPGFGCRAARVLEDVR